MLLEAEIRFRFESMIADYSLYLYFRVDYGSHWSAPPVAVSATVIFAKKTND